ncbi:hypothetical protein BC940DRAFT_301996 [Gongronella butleri]|nr:hypothetical protein BC940DRAFT_301996 [Gongronella butleri]
MTCWFSQLPPEIVDAIFSHIPVIDLKRLRLVCLAWNRHACHVVFRQLTITHAQPTVHDVLLAFDSPRLLFAPWIQALAMDVRQMTLPLLRQLQAHCRNVSHWTLSLSTLHDINQCLFANEKAENVEIATNKVHPRLAAFLHNHLLHDLQTFSLVLAVATDQCPCNHGTVPTLFPSHAIVPLLSPMLVTLDLNNDHDPTRTDVALIEAIHAACPQLRRLNLTLAAPDTLDAVPLHHVLQDYFDSASPTITIKRWATLTQFQVTVPAPADKFPDTLVAYIALKMPCLDDLCVTTVDDYHHRHHRHHLQPYQDDDQPVPMDVIDPWDVLDQVRESLGRNGGPVDDEDACPRVLVFRGSTLSAKAFMWPQLPSCLQLEAPFSKLSSFLDSQHMPDTSLVESLVLLGGDAISHHHLFLSHILTLFPNVMSLQVSARNFQLRLYVDHRDEIIHQQDARQTQLPPIAPDIATHDAAHVASTLHMSTTDNFHDLPSSSNLRGYQHVDTLLYPLEQLHLSSCVLTSSQHLERLSLQCPLLRSVHLDGVQLLQSEGQLPSVMHNSQLAGLVSLGQLPHDLIWVSLPHARLEECMINASFNNKLPGQPYRTPFCYMIIQDPAFALGPVLRVFCVDADSIQHGFYYSQLNSDECEWLLDCLLDHDTNLHAYQLGNTLRARQALRECRYERVIVLQCRSIESFCVDGYTLI